ncbi:hypothetical protein OROHE_022205 [Orobanche hederae]
MADFTTSTHRAKWIFTPQDLKEKYKDANKRAKQALEKYGATRMEIDIDGSCTYVEPQRDAKNSSDKHSRPKALKTEEEQLLRAFYEFKIQDVCDAFRFPRKIQRLTCIYAACKAEENYVSAEELGKGIEQDHQMILNNEMLVLQSLGIDLIVYAPYRALDGFISDMEELYDGKLVQSEIIKNLHESAKVEVDKIMRSDAPLLFPPGQDQYTIVACMLLLQLALAALRRASEVHKVIDFESYVESMLSRQHPAHNLSDLKTSLNAIDLLTSKKGKHRSKESSTRMHVMS